LDGGFSATAGVLQLPDPSRSTNSLGNMADDQSAYRKFSQSEFRERGTFGPATAGLVLLRLCQFRFPAHALPALLRPAAALGGAGSDKVALHVRQAAENGQHQAASAGAGVGPRLGERTKLRLGVHDLLDDGEQVEGAAREAVDPRDCHHVAGCEGLQHFEKLAPVVVRARHLLAVNLAASYAAQLLKLGVESLPVGTDAGIAETAVFGGWFGLGFQFRSGDKLREA
jgi:hypothetical protein